VVSSPSPPAAPDLRPSLARLLRPLVRLAIQRGMTFPVLAELLRELFVDVARHDLLRGRRAQTDSRVSLLTGIHRKELRRQRLAPAAPAPAALTLSSQIIARWLGLPPWVDAAGAPLPLPRSAPAPAPSFDALVASVTRDLRPRAVLDEWLSRGLVRLDAAERVVLNAAAYLPRPGGAEQLFYFGRNLHDHIAAAAANVLAEGPAPFLDRSVHYDRLPAPLADSLATLARQAAERALLEINRAALERLGAEAQAEPAGPSRRVNLGMFLYVEDEPPREGEGSG
jgi:hypothetical protein